MTEAVPIAVIGMACRFPGAESTEALADLLRAGGCGVGAVPPARRALCQKPFSKRLQYIVGAQQAGGRVHRNRRSVTDQAYGFCGGLHF